MTKQQKEIFDEVIKGSKGYKTIIRGRNYGKIYEHPFFIKLLKTLYD